MDFGDLFRAVISLIFVVGLIGLGYWLIKRSGLGLGLGAPMKPGKRLSVSEMRVLDPRRKLVLIRLDDVEHLILLSATGETVIETGIMPPDGAPNFKNDKPGEAG